MEMYVDEQKVSGTTHLAWSDWLTWPSERPSWRLGRHLLRLFRQDIRVAVRLFIASERLTQHEGEVADEKLSLDQQRTIAATVQAAESALSA